MSELRIKIPDELEKTMKEFKLDWSEIALEAIRLKVFESHLSRSRKLRRAVFEALVSKSKLTKKDALELGSKVKEGMLKELKEKGLV